ncbi:GPR1/FUN34/yaaH family-domain-containing protein [Xylaria nigripes]|nr:GPR1/FUN34/yaaH family-domain-containing protein [Xylaria nigripes]
MASQVFVDRDIEKQLPSSIAALASANPLGLLAFGQALYFLSLFEFAPRGVTTTNIVVGNMLWMEGVAQFIAGIIDFCAGNGFGAAVFTSYAAFNLAYSAIFIPGSGILASYSDSTTNLPREDFFQAVALFVWSWFMITFIFTIGACQSNYVLFGLLCMADITLIMLAVGYMVNSDACRHASGIFVYAAAAYLYVDGATPFTLPLFPIRKDRSIV